MAGQLLTTSQLYKAAPLNLISASTTKQIIPLDEIIGQDRAQDAVEFGMKIKEKGYNIYAIGQNGLGKQTMVKRYLGRHQNELDELYDWCYISNFNDSRSPQILKVPAGMGLKLKSNIEGLMKRIQKALPLAFDNEVYFNRSEQLKNQLAQEEEETLANINQEAKDANISLSITPHGDYQFIAMNGEEPHSDETFSKLSSEEQSSFGKTIDSLEIQLRKVLRTITELEESYSQKIQDLNNETASQVLKHNFIELIRSYKKHKVIKDHLKLMQKDILDNLDIFLQDSEEQAGFAYASLDKKLPRRYMINVIVAQDDNKYPVVVEENPNYHTIFGYIENATYKGTVFTDFSLIRSGSLHKANGGVLMIDAIKVLERPYVWDGLKRALRSQQLALVSLERELTLSGTISLEPEPIPLDVKIILFGDYQTYQLLQHYDPEFGELFRVTADFEDEMPRNDESELQYARFISSIVHDNKLLHCDKKAIARIIEFSARQADDKNKLSLYSARISNLLRETHFIAKSANATVIRVGHVEQALKHQEKRVSRIKDTVMDSFKNGTTLIQTKGSAVGQVNALAVLATTDYMFGAPNRITVNTRYGDGEFLDIERYVNMSGQIHSKGVMILTSYLSAIFAKSARIPLTTTLTFEQNYGGVDGDSASMAEVCAIVSAFSEIAINQEIGITGSMNQFGETQPIGGVNEKIEGFFDVCKIKGRTPKQGVVIPASNVQNLMLRADIRKEVEDGHFHIWSVTHVTEAIELLLGKEAQQVFDIAQAKLNTLKR